jgi:hypothetical protein
LQRHDGRAGIMSKYVFTLKDGKIFSKHEFDEAQNEEYLRQLLEKLLEKCPEIIVPAAREGEPAKNIYITREFGVSSGSIDLLGVDGNGYIYIMETKLYRSSERRRALAQVLEYVSALWAEYSRNPDVFIEKLMEKAPSTMEDLKNVKEAVKKGLVNGDFRLVIAMDYIDEPTEKIINFLNEMCEFEVYGLSLEIYRSDDGFEVVVPRLYPQSPPEPTVSTLRRIWSWDTFLEDAKENIPEYIEALRDLHGFSVEITNGKGGLRWGRGKKYGTFGVYISDLFNGKDIFGVNSQGYLAINFANLYPLELSDEKSRKTAEIVDKFADQLYNVGLLKEKINQKNYREAGKQYPLIRVEQWANKISELKEIIKELISNMRNEKLD